MNTTKRYLAPILMTASVALLAAGCFTGCMTEQHVTTAPDGTSVTNTVTKLDPARTSKAIHAIITPATSLAVSEEPKVRPYVEKAQVAICTAAAAGKYSPDELKAAINATGINEIKTPEVQAALQSVYGIYDAYFGDVVAQKLNQNDWLIPVLSSICESLKDGLAPPAPSKIHVTPSP
jgi:hypothetical protein